MKKDKLVLVIPLMFSLLFGVYSCNDSDDEPEADTKKFLSEIRPIFFDNLDFTSSEIVSDIPSFLQNIKETFDDVETQYNAGVFQSVSDLENMRLFSQYFSFYMLGLTGTYLDGGLTFEQINGNRQKGLFSGLDASTVDFEQKEMEAMMKRAEAVIERGYNINGYNDKAYGFYVAVRQVHERLKNNNLANPEAHNDAIDYVGVRLINYDVIANWNVLMSMVTMTNYDDPRNTFDNPRMDELLFHVNARLVPGSLADLGGRYPEILGPLYRFDLNLKKLDWIIQTNDQFSETELEALDYHIQILETASNFIKNERTALLNSWDDKNTFDERVAKMEQIKAFRQNIEQTNQLLGKPDLKSFINSGSFKRAYQCYSCHKPSGL